MRSCRRERSAGDADVIDEQSPAYPASATAQLEQRVDQLEGDQQLLTGKMNDQYQTKVESASKYRVRFSGIVLFNLFGNSGYFDNQDVPTWVTRPDPMDSAGAVGGTLRQTILGFEAFGPDLMGARTSANVNFDFGGGFPATYNGVDSGLVRLRTAAVRLDWKNTSVIAGQDPLFLAPLSPTSFASLIVPPLSYAGNLWAWTPQLRVEHRFALSSDSTVTLQGALMDPLTGEPPDQQYTWYRSPDAGEEGRQPAYALASSPTPILSLDKILLWERAATTAARAGALTASSTAGPAPWTSISRWAAASPSVLPSIAAPRSGDWAALWDAV